VSANYCGLSSNIGIQESAISSNKETYKLSQSAVYVTADNLLTSVVMARQRTARLVVMGTNRGQVVKVTESWSPLIMVPFG
jgi:hypothetical protein